MNIPTTIEIKSDGNKLQFIEEKKGIYKYKYIESKSKLGMVLEMDEITLTKLINTNK
jgi:hypothetical protein